MDVKKVALITGGLGDLGSAIVKTLHAEFSIVLVLDVATQETVDAWLSDMHKEYPRVGYYHMNVCDFEECHTVIEKIIQDHGRIDALINNAGITRDAVFYKMTKKQWDDVIHVNLDGMFNVTRPVVDYMRKQESGRIVNISSVNGQKGQYSQANYAASKAGVYGFTKSLAQELIAKNITVNSVSPGYVDSRLMQGIRPDILQTIIEQIPAKRLAKPEEIAWAVAFLVHENSAYITGSNLSINGGLLMSS